MSPEEFARSVNRRTFLTNSAYGFGAIAFASLLERAGAAIPAKPADGRWRGVIAQPHFPVKAKRIIHLCRKSPRFSRRLRPSPTTSASCARCSPSRSITTRRTLL